MCATVIRQHAIRRSNFLEQITATTLLYAIWLLTPTILIPLNTAYAQGYFDKISLKNILQDLDLSPGEVSAMLQDDDGFMWFGGRNMLLRYDGYELLEVKVKEKSDSGHDERSVFWTADLYQDSQKQLWVASQSGLLLLDSDQTILHPIQLKHIEEHGIQGVTALAESHTQQLLIGTYLGLIVYNPKTLEETTWMRTTGQYQGLVNDVVRDIKVNNNVVWLATDGGLSKLNLETREVSNFLPSPDKPESIAENGLREIAIDKNGQLWIAGQNGFYKFDPDNNSFRQFHHDAKNPYSLADNLLWDVYIDSKGLIWIASNSGLDVYDQENDRFRHYVHEVGGLPEESVRCILEDKIGDLWISSYPGAISIHDRSTTSLTVYKHDDNNPNSLAVDNVDGIVEDDQGNLWLGTGVGIDYFDRKTRTFKHYYSTHDSNSRVPSSSILSGYIDSNKDIWFGSWGKGFFRFNPATDQFDQIPYDESLIGQNIKTTDKIASSKIWNFYEDSQNNFWIGTHESGLVNYDRKAKTFTHYLHDPDDPTTISNHVVWQILEDSQGTLWVGTAYGLNILDRETGTFTNYKVKKGKPGSPENDSFLSIYEDKKNRLWFGTDAGLHFFDRETESFTVYNKKNGFSNEVIRSIIADKNGNLWMGTNNGITMFNPDSKKVKNYQRYNGNSIGGFPTGSAIVSQNGEMIFGGNNGLIIFDIQKMTTNIHAPPVALTDFKLFANSITPGDDKGILTKDINKTKEITLNYKQNMFSFDFAALNFRDPEKNTYAYMLEGFDHDWHFVGPQRRAQFTNLSPGKYIFRVKASNNDGVWNNKGKSVHIIQLPPPWASWWAYTGYILTIVLIIIRVIQSQRRKRKLVEKLNQELEIKVADRTRDLQDKNNDIKSMLENMKQGLCTILVNQRIHPEYSQHLENIFETEGIAHKDAFELIFTNANISASVADQVREVLSIILGENDIIFDFNSHLLIKDFSINIGNKVKHLSLDWNPIVVHSKVDKLMVTVRDVTMLKQAEEDIKQKNRELDIISQLINITDKQFKGFERSCQAFITENKQWIETLDAHNVKNPIEKLFRNMHTIKGNCRTLGLTYLGDAAHQVESYYTLARSMSNVGNAKPNTEQLTRDMAFLEKVFAEYLRINNDVLGREKDFSNRDQNGYWIDHKTLVSIRSAFYSVRKQHPETYQQHVSESEHALENNLTVSFNDLLGGIVQSLPDIAHQLGKEPPTVVLPGTSLRVYQEQHELINHVFSHLLTNCIDHGIETPATRISVNKNPQGSILITTEKAKDSITFSVSDDGQGLALDKLYQKAIELNIWPKEYRPTIKEVADLIFHSGLSTKKYVSTLSGRGVGMDAVKVFLQESGGEVDLMMSNAESPYIPSETPLNTAVTFQLVFPLHFFRCENI